MGPTEGDSDSMYEINVRPLVSAYITDHLLRANFDYLDPTTEAELQPVYSVLVGDCNHADKRISIRNTFPGNSDSHIHSKN